MLKIRSVVSETCTYPKLLFTRYFFIFSKNPKRNGKTPPAFFEGTGVTLTSELAKKNSLSLRHSISFHVNPRVF